MLRAILYSLLIMVFFGILLLCGLFGPEQGKIVVQKFIHFIKWVPPHTNESLLKDTEVAIKEFNESYKKIQTLRLMTLSRNEQTFNDLEEVYKQTRERLKELLFDMGKLSPSDRSDIFKKLSVLHAGRAGLVEAIIRDQQVMINLNEQMDQELQAMSQWLNQKAQETPAPTAKDMMRMQQYESLRANLKTFNEQSSHLDSMRILFMKKSRDSIQRLAETNKDLENYFRELLSQVELSTSEQSPDLWQNYQRLEAEQRDLVVNLRSTEEFITANQGQLISGITVISETVEYSSDSQLKRFKDNFAMMQEKRSELLKDMHQRQQIFLNTQLSTRQMMEDNRYRMENMRQQARQISDQFERMEEYRKSATSMIRSMTSEIKDKNAFASQQTEEVMERSRDHIQQFMAQMDSAQSNVNDLIKNGAQSMLADSSALHQLSDLKEKSKTFLENLKKNEDQLRSLSDQTRRDQVSAIQMKKDAIANNTELLRSAKERTDDQKRIMSERIQDQVQRLKDQRMNQR